MPTTTKRLCALPVETLYRVAAHLSACDLVNLACANSALRGVCRVPLSKLSYCVDVLVSEEGGQVLNPALKDEQYASQVRCISVRSHEHEVCSKIDLPPLPNVNMVRLQLESESFEEAVLHEDDRYACSLLGLGGVKTVVVVEPDDLQSEGVKRVFPDNASSSIKSAVLLLKPELSSTCTAAHNEFEEGDGEHPTRMDLVAAFAPKNVSSFTVVYQHTEAAEMFSGWMRKFDDAIKRPASKFVQGIFDLCDDIGYNPDILKSLPSLKVFTVVVPDGVMSAECRRYMMDKIKVNFKQYKGKKLPAVRIFDMSEMMNSNEYAHVMTPKQRKLWAERARLPHYKMTTKEVQQCINKSKEHKSYIANALKAMGCDFDSDDLY